MMTFFFLFLFFCIVFIEYTVLCKKNANEFSCELPRIFEMPIISVKAKIRVTFATAALIFERNFVVA